MTDLSLNCDSPLQGLDPRNNPWACFLSQDAVLSYRLHFTPANGDEMAGLWIGDSPALHLRVEKCLLKKRQRLRVFLNEENCRTTLCHLPCEASEIELMVQRKSQGLSVSFDRGHGPELLLRDFQPRFSSGNWCVAPFAGHLGESLGSVVLFQKA